MQDFATKGTQLRKILLNLTAFRGKFEDEETMGTCLKQYDKDYMKMAMLKQEETFRQQVHELHRLYRVQKLLMNDTQAEIKRQRKSSSTRACGNDRWNAENETDMHQQNQTRARQVLNLELPAEEYIEEESDLELTLATGGSRRRKNGNSFTSDSGASFSSSSTESGGVKLNGNEWGLFRVPDVNIGSYRSERKSKFNAEEQMISEERVKRPPWLFQCLSLNMT